MFLLVAEALSRIIHKAKEEGKIKGVGISSTVDLTHILFVDDVLLMGEVSYENVQALVENLEQYQKAKEWL